MSDVARYDRGGWVVPVGAVIKDELRACDHCGHDVNVLTVRTKDGTEVMADDLNEYADEDTTTCADCLRMFGEDD